MELQFLDSLKSALLKLDSISNEIEILKLQKEELREKVIMWLKINKLSSFECLLPNSTQVYKLNISNVQRTSINREILSGLLTEKQLEMVTNITNVETFSFRRIKSKTTVLSKGTN